MPHQIAACTETPNLAFDVQAWAFLRRTWPARWLGRYHVVDVRRCSTKVDSGQRYLNTTSGCVDWLKVAYLSLDCQVEPIGKSTARRIRMRRA